MVRDFEHDHNGHRLKVSDRRTAGSVASAVPARAMSKYSLECRLGQPSFTREKPRWPNPLGSIHLLREVNVFCGCQGLLVQANANV